MSEGSSWQEDCGMEEQLTSCCARKQKKGKVHNYSQRIIVELSVEVLKLTSIQTQYPPLTHHFKI